MAKSRLTRDTDIGLRTEAVRFRAVDRERDFRLISDIIGSFSGADYQEYLPERRFRTVSGTGRNNSLLLRTAHTFEEESSIVLKYCHGG
jgi:hypothetical protein